MWLYILSHFSSITHRFDERSNMLARSYHDLHECNSSQLVIIIIAFIRNHLEHNILWELCHFSTGASRPLLWLLRKANTGEIFRMLVTFRLWQPGWPPQNSHPINEFHPIFELESSQPQWPSSGTLLHLCRTTIFAFVCILAFAGRAFLHFCLCRMSRGWTHLAPTGSLTRRTFLQPSSDLLSLKWWKWKCQWSWLMDYFYQLNPG